MTAQRLALVLAIFGLSYFLSLFFRSVNAIIAPDLVAELGIDAAGLGLLTAGYFLGMGLMQVPIGVFLDTYGPKIVQSALLAVAALGIALFAMADGLMLLTIARALIGIGLGGSLMSAFQVAALWLPPARLPLANACYLAIGGLGVLASTAPVEAALEFVDWRGLFALIAAVTLLVGLGIAVLTPMPKGTGSSPRWTDQVRGLQVVAASSVMWRYLPLTAICFATGTALQGLWAASWFRDIAGLDRAAVAFNLAGMAVALTIGSVAGGLVTVLLKRFGLRLRHVVLGCAALFIMAQAGIIFGPVSIAVVFWIGLCLTYNVVTLSYALVAQTFPIVYAGRSNTFMNTFVILATFALQYGIGIGLEFWDGGRTSVHSSEAYTMTFSALLSLQVLCFLWSIRREPR
ncbi:MFS transporter [Rhodoligotrophos defluvii]|uniref:MFS transporter n=1 Tax=Rhodoligotrophos defluvii TaxID=2561934 RepID=UPI001484D3F9|nr:MFS transporter [Rhodoligotrophos defluvii]